MSVVFSHSLVLGSGGGGGIDLAAPMIGWNNLLVRQSFTSSSSSLNHPAILAGNPSTSEYWSADSVGTQYLDASVGGEESYIEYIGIARHNLGSSGNRVRVLYEDDGGSMVELVPLFDPADDSVIFIRVPPTVTSRIRVEFSGGVVPPRLAVLSAGPLLTMQRNIYVGHTPLTMGRSIKNSTAETESGQFQGRIITGESHATEASFSNLTPDWYREEFEPFSRASDELPFFFAWRPRDYPLEVGYCWMTSAPIPNNQLNNGMMQVSMSLQGIVRRNSSIIVTDPMVYA